MSWRQELQSRMAEGCSLLARNHSKDIQMNEHWLGHLHSMGDFLLSSLETTEPCTEFNKKFMRIITGHFLVRIEARTHGTLHSKQPCIQAKAKGVWGQPFLA